MGESRINCGCSAGQFSRQINLTALQTCNPTHTGADSARVNGAPYQDEYILDQFYLNRTNGSDRTSIVPVTGRPSDDVYIIF